MFASRARHWNCRRRSVGIVVHRLGRAMSWVAFVAATLILITFATATGSQACSDKNSRTLLVHPTKTAASVVVHSTPRVVAKRPATAALGVQLAVANADCCASPSGHDYVCPGTCCSACSAALAVPRPAVALVPIRRFIVAAAPQTQLPSNELDTQFRPPRDLV